MCLFAFAELICYLNSSHFRANYSEKPFCWVFAVSFESSKTNNIATGPGSFSRKVHMTSVLYLEGSLPPQLPPQHPSFRSILRHIMEALSRPIPGIVRLAEFEFIFLLRFLELICYDFHMFVVSQS